MYSEGAVTLNVVSSERLCVLDLLLPLLPSCLRRDTQRVCLAARAGSQRDAERVHESLGEERPVPRGAAVLSTDLIDVVVSPFGDPIGRYELQEVDVYRLTLGVQSLQQG